MRGKFNGGLRMKRQAEKLIQAIFTSLLLQPQKTGVEF